MHTAYIGIGTNIEPRLERMQNAIKSLSILGIVELKSPIYETAPFGYTEQSDFLNGVVMLQTRMELTDLHRSLKDLEKGLGRTERERWHEREIDFDILFYDDTVNDSETLQVPHPQLQKRSFVLVPLNDIAQDLIHPLLGKSIAELLKELDYNKHEIHRL